MQSFFPSGFSARLSCVYLTLRMIGMRHARELVGCEWDY